MRGRPKREVSTNQEKGNWKKKLEVAPVKSALVRRATVGADGIERLPPQRKEI